MSRRTLSFTSHFISTALFALSQQLIAAPQTCSYNTYQWSTLEKQAVNHKRVSHPYNELTQKEIDPTTGCTVCSEDQVMLQLPDLAPFFVCKAVAPYIEAALLDLIEAGEPIHQLVGYRVGMTRGDTDGEGLRTQFSNHSYGIAIDINSQHNGLYDKCIQFGPDCRLIRGGKWQPNTQHASLRADGPVVLRFKREGFKWGGKIRGKQKDFMHFSPSGY